MPRTLLIAAIAIFVGLPFGVDALTGPALTVTPGSGLPASSIQVKGTGFAGRTNGQLLFDGGAGGMPAFKASAKGAFSVAATVPASATPGAHVISAKMTSGSQAGQVVAIATFTVPAPSPPPTASPTATPPAPATPDATPLPTADATTTMPSAATATPAPTPSIDPSPTPAPTATPVVPAFPGATGYGAATRGGRGGDVYYVTTLADSGPGSLRSALEASGPRTVIFATSGTISLASPVKVWNPYLTVAGQTAPGQGVVVRGEAVRILTHDVVIRHMRFRPGDATTLQPGDTDALTIHGVAGPIGNIILDHVDMVWGPDMGGVSVLGPVTNLTVQNSIMGEGLYLSRHPEGTVANGGHAYAANVTPMVLGGGHAGRLTFYRNLFTDADKRMPAIKSAECVDLINNVIYDWGRQAVAGNPRSLNIVGNWFRWGPATESRALFKSLTVTADPVVYPDAVYLEANVADGFVPASATGTVYATSVRCGSLSATPDAGPSLLADVLNSAGATLPVRDEVDRRIVDEVLSGTGGYFNGVGYALPNPYWPDLAIALPPLDLDVDGMPDTWELLAFGGMGHDGRADSDADGYTDLEEYLNDTAP